jgi:hypothetical protein
MICNHSIIVHPIIDGISSEGVAAGARPTTPATSRPKALPACA